LSLVEKRQLAAFRAQYMKWVPWLQRNLHATVTITEQMPNGSFFVVVRWGEGENQVYKKEYGPAIVKQRVGCLREHARRLIREVFERRGV